MARFFLDHGADATAKDNSNDLAAQAIHIAAAVGAVDVVELLIEHGAPVDARDRQNDTPLDFAAMRNQLKMISFLVAKGAGLNTSNAYGRTPLHSAAGSGSKDAVALLLALGADKTAKDIQGKTPYDLAEESTDLSAAGKAAILPLLQTLAASPSDPASSQHGCPHSEEDLQSFYRRAHQRSPTASGLVVYNIVKDELQMMGCPTGQ